jgi:hypothetical protein
VSRRHHGRPEQSSRERPHRSRQARWRARDLTDGPAEVNLGVCAQGSSQTDTFIPNCSYTYLVKRAAPSFTYLTSQGAVSWKDGSLAGTALSFPAAGQTWPALTGLYLNASSVATAANITGTVDANGKVDLTLAYDNLLTAGSAQCRLTGTVQLSSQGTEKFGGAAGSNYDPATGRFAVVSTTYAAPNAIDVSRRRLPGDQHRLRPVAGHGLVPHRDDGTARRQRRAGRRWSRPRR